MFLVVLCLELASYLIITIDDDTKDMVFIVWDLNSY
jgi:hypothetical protein